MGRNLGFEFKLDAKNNPGLVESRSEQLVLCLGICRFLYKKV